ncbi:hypothetical protein [Flagellimonas sp.]|uniref:hypothetical protein n=1 Tax=Flagellimonas sp. TaxID=2058762 RepID=UPI003BA9DB8B
MERKYRSLTLFFVVILLLAPLGFQRYLMKLGGGVKQSWIVHSHAVCMTVWCLLLIAQPILVKVRKHKIHRAIGRFSYFFFPVLVWSIIGVMSYSYIRLVDVLDQVQRQAMLFVPFTQMILFTLFFGLALIYKKSPRLHMRYVICSSVALLGPTIGRIDFGFLNHINMDLWVMDICLLGFWVYDRVTDGWPKPFLYGLLGFASVHVMNEFVPLTEEWGALVVLFFD